MKPFNAPWIRLALMALFAFKLALHAVPAPAKNDVNGGRDYPRLTRFPNSHMVKYSKNFKSVEFAVGTGPGNAEVRQRVEGNATRLMYFHNDANQQPSALELIRNYQNAIKSIGGEVVSERLPLDIDGGETILRVNAADIEVWVRVVPGIFSAPTQSYTINIVEVTAIVGHTSRSGSETYNDRLSAQRAAAIRQRLGSEAAELNTRTKTSGVGFRENIIGTGTDDATDALDRRVEFRMGGVKGAMVSARIHLVLAQLAPQLQLAAQDLQVDA